MMKPVLSKDVVEQDLGEEMVLLDLSNGTYHGLNGVGMFVWKALRAGTEQEMIPSLIAQQFDVELAHAHADMDEFLKQLGAAGLLRND